MKVLLRGKELEGVDVKKRRIPEKMNDVIPVCVGVSAMLVGLGLVTFLAGITSAGIISVLLLALFWTARLFLT